MGPELAEIHRAAQALRQGELVVFPTETVYGLGAHALDPLAVAKIFAAKGRPSDNPLIVHVADTASARRLVASWPSAAERLSARFWPGPLTIVLPRSPVVPDVVTAGLDTVGVRVPSHPIGSLLLREARVPVAAPSANKSGRPSPTRLSDAQEDLGTAVKFYLDGGPTPIGVESAVVGLYGSTPVLLRPGGLPREEIETVVGPLAPPPEGAARSPGLRHRHYAPRARLRLVPAGRGAAEAEAMRRTGKRVALVAMRGTQGADARLLGEDAAAWARGLFALLRDLDRQGYDAVVVEEVGATGLGEAVLDRLRRAAEGQSTTENVR